MFRVITEKQIKANFGCSTVKILFCYPLHIYSVYLFYLLRRTRICYEIHIKFNIETSRILLQNVGFS